MSNTILLKRSSTPSDVPTLGDLEVGELAINTADGKIFTRTAGDVIIEVAGKSASTLLSELLSVDGDGSGLDSDLLDGQHGSYYRNAGNLNAGTIPSARLPQATTTVQGSLEIATTAEVRSKASDKSLTPSNAFAAADRVALTDAANISIDLSTGINFGVTINDNRTLDFPTNVASGQSGYIRVVQDATGGRVLSFGSGYIFANGTPVAVSTGADSVSYIFYQAVSSSEVILSVMRNVS